MDLIIFHTKEQLPVQKMDEVVQPVEINTGWFWREVFVQPLYIIATHRLVDLEALIFSDARFPEVFNTSSEIIQLKDVVYFLLA